MLQSKWDCESESSRGTARCCQLGVGYFSVMAPSHHLREENAGAAPVRNCLCDSGVRIWSILVTFHYYWPLNTMMMPTPAQITSCFYSLKYIWSKPWFDIHRERERGVDKSPFQVGSRDPAEVAEMKFGQKRWSSTVILFLPISSRFKGRLGHLGTQVSSRTQQQQIFKE